MAKHITTCLVCGRKYNDYDAAPRFFCSVACAADSGEVVVGDMAAMYRKVRPARTPPRIARNIKKAKVSAD